MLFRSTTDIVANQMQMIGGRPSAGEEPQRHPKEEAQQSFPADDSDIPF